MQLERTVEIQSQVEAEFTLTVQDTWEDAAVHFAQMQETDFQFQYEVETVNSPKQDTYLSRWNTRERQFYYFVQLTSEGKALPIHDITYILLSLLPRKNPSLHDKTRAKFMGWVYDSAFFSEHSIPEINRAWCLQSVSYMLENGKFKDIQDALQAAPVNSDFSLLIKEFSLELKSADSVRRRFAAVAFSYLPFDVHSPETNLIFDTLLEMLNLPPVIRDPSIISDPSIDKAFAIERELDNLRVRASALKAIINLVKRNVPVPGNIVEMLSSFLFPIYKNDKNYKIAELFLGQTPQKSIQNVSSTDSDSWKYYETYEKDALAGKRFGNYFYLYKGAKKGNVHCIRALFYSVVLNGREIPSYVETKESFRMKAIDLREIVTTCYRLISSNDKELQFASLLLLMVIQYGKLPYPTDHAQLEKVVGALSTKFSTLKQSLKFSQCCAAFSFALKTGPQKEYLSESKHGRAVNAKFDHLRAQVLHIFLCHLCSTALDSSFIRKTVVALTAQIKDLLNATDAELRIFAELVLSRTNPAFVAEWDPAFIAKCKEELKTADLQQHAIMNIMLMIQTLSIDSISVELLLSLEGIFRSTDQDLIKERILAAYNSLLQKTLNQNVQPVFIFSGPFLEAALSYHDNYSLSEISSFFYLNLSLVAEKYPIYSGNLDVLVTRINFFSKILVDDNYGENTKQNILLLLKILIARYFKNPVTRDWIPFQESLLFLWKQSEFELLILNILVLLTPHRIIFLGDLIQELIFRMNNHNSDLAARIQTILGFYIRDQDEDNKFPDNCIVCLIEKLMDDTYFAFVEPLIRFLIITEKFNKHLSQRCLLLLLEYASSDNQHFTSLTCSKLLIHCTASFKSSKSLDALKRSIISSYEKDLFSECSFLVSTFFRTSCTQSLAVDEELMKPVSFMFERSMIAPNDRLLIYQYLSGICDRCPFPIRAQAIRDINGNDNVAKKSITLISCIINSKSTLEMEPERLLAVLSNEIGRPRLKNTLLNCIKSLLEAYSYLVSYALQKDLRLIEVCLNLQYFDGKVTSSKETRCIALELLKLFKGSAHRLLQSIEEICDMEAKSNALLKDSLADEAFVTFLRMKSSEKRLLGFRTVEYLVYLSSQTGLDNNSIFVEIFTHISSNGQDILPVVTGYLIKYIQQFKQFKDKVISAFLIIKNCVAFDSRISDSLYSVIKSFLKFDLTELSQSSPHPNFYDLLLEILLIQTKRANLLDNDSLDVLIGYFKGPYCKEEHKPIAAFIISVHLESNFENSLKLGMNGREMFTIYLNLLTENKIQGYSSSFLINIMKSLDETEWNKLKSYFKLKDMIVQLKEVKHDLSKITKEVSDIVSQLSFHSNYVRREEIRRDIYRMIEELITKYAETRQKLNRNILNVVKTMCKEFDDFHLSESFIQKMTITVAQTIIKYRPVDYVPVILILEIVEALVVHKSLLKVVDIRNVSNSLGCLIRCKVFEERIHNLFNLLIESVANIDDGNGHTLSEELRTYKNRLTLTNQVRSHSQVQDLIDHISAVSYNLINFQYDHFENTIENIVSSIEENNINIESLKIYLCEGFCYEDFLNLEKLFELFNTNKEIILTFEVYSNLSKLINNCESLPPNSKLNIVQLLRICQVYYVLEGLNQANTKNATMKESILGLLNAGWSPCSLVTIGNRFLTTPYPEILFDMMMKYHIKEEQKQRLLILPKTVSLPELRKEFSEINFEFADSGKTITELVTEFSLANELSCKLQTQLRDFITEICHVENASINLIPLVQWKKSHFLEFSEHAHKEPLITILKVVNQAVKVFTACVGLPEEKQEVNQPMHDRCKGYYLRPSQILAIYELLNRKENIIGQLSTGEGKSLVIAVVALVKCIQEKISVDIAVISPILAERDAHYFQSLYGLFGKKCMHNIYYSSSKEVSKGALDCYKADVVYGEISQFEFDLLRDEFQKLQTRGNRKYELILVDEADSIMIDQARNIAKLANVLPGFDSLDFIFICIWSRLERLLNGFTICLHQPSEGNNNSAAATSSDKTVLEPETVYIYKSKDSDELLYSYLVKVGGTNQNNEEIRDCVLSTKIQDHELLNRLRTFIDAPDIDQLMVTDNDSREIKNNIFYWLFTGDMNDHYELSRAIDPVYEIDVENGDKDESGRTERTNELGLLLYQYIGIILDLPDVRDEFHKASNSNFPTQDGKHDRILFPKHLMKDFIFPYIKTWINNAMHAKFNMHLDIDYVYVVNEYEVTTIVPIDNQTGVTLLNTNWSDGIHQFLQLKEGLKISSVTLTTNFISNFSFLRRYKQLIGLTGTLGNEQTRTLLIDLYRKEKKVPEQIGKEERPFKEEDIDEDEREEENETSVHCLLFPLHRKQMYICYPPYLSTSTDDWLNKIRSSVALETSLDRAVLIICQSIYHLNQISGCLKGTPNISVFRRSDLDVIEANRLYLDCTQIWLTTNLGGRGIDPKPSPRVVENGGVHVIVTFLADNERIHQQAVGRTSRNGNPGTSELILDLSHFVSLQSNVSLSYLELYRDELERQRFQTLQQDLADVISRDHLFKKFCKFLQQMDQKWKDNQNLKEGKWLCFTGACTNFIIKKKNESKRQALIERWGRGLKSWEFNKLSHQAVNLHSEFLNFVKDMKFDDDNNRLIDNPCYLLQETNAIIEYSQSLKHTILNLGIYGTIVHKAVSENCFAITDPLFIGQAKALLAYSCLRDGEEQEQVVETVYSENVSIRKRVKPPSSAEKQKPLECKIQQNTIAANIASRNYFKAACEQLYRQNFPQLMLQQHHLMRIQRNLSSCEFLSQISDKIVIIIQFANIYEKAYKQIDAARKVISLTIHHSTSEQVTHERKTRNECITILEEQSTNNLLVDVEFYNLRLVYDVWKKIRQEPNLLIQQFTKLELPVPHSHYLTLKFPHQSTAFYIGLIEKLKKFSSEVQSIYEVEVVRIVKTTDLTELEKLVKRAKQENKDVSDYPLKTVCSIVPLSTFQEPISVSEEVCSINFSLRSLNTASVLKLIESLRSEIKYAIFLIQNITILAAKALICKTNFTEESFKSIYLRDISLVFSNPHQSNEVYHAKANGFKFFMELEEKQPLQIYSMMIVLTIASIETTVGALVLTLTAPTVFGIGIGIGLITDGISDGFDLIRIGIVHEHNWLHYGIQKFVSMGIIFLTAGVSSMMAVKAKTAANTAVKGSNLGGVLMKSTGKAVGPNVVKTVVVQEVTRTTVYKAVNLVTDSLGKLVTPQLYDQVAGRIRELVEEKLMTEFKTYSNQLTHIFAHVHIRKDTEKQLQTEISNTIQERLGIAFGAGNHKSLSALLSKNTLITKVIEPAVNSTFQDLFTIQANDKNFRSLVKHHLDTFFPGNYQAVERYSTQIIQTFDEAGLVIAGYLTFINEIQSADNISLRLSTSSSWPVQCNGHKESICQLYLQYYSLVHFAVLNPNSSADLHGSNSRDVYGNPQHPLWPICKSFRDFLFTTMVSIISRHLNKAIDELVTLAKNGAQLPFVLSLAPSKMFEPSSLLDIRTYHDPLRVLDPRRFEFIYEMSGSLVENFVAATLFSGSIVVGSTSLTGEAAIAPLAYPAPSPPLSATANSTKETTKKSVLAADARNSNTRGAPTSTPSSSEVNDYFYVFLVRVKFL